MEAEAIYDPPSKGKHGDTTVLKITNEYVCTLLELYHNFPNEEAKKVIVSAFA